MDIVTELKRARAVGVPLVAITTADQPAALHTLAKGFEKNKKPAPLLAWDIIRGLMSMNDAGDAALEALGVNSDTAEQFTNLVTALEAMRKAKQGTILVVVNAHRFLDEVQPMQCVMNLRDLFKGSRCMLVLMGPAFKLPPEIAQDVHIIDEPLPSLDEIKAIVGGFWDEAKVSYTAELMERSTDALRGLAAFPVEQSAALALQPDKSVAVKDLWDRKRQAINQVAGLVMESPSDTLDDLGGMDNWKTFATKFWNGPRRPRVIVFIDEIEKAMGGNGAMGGQGDTSGTSQDQLGVLLSEMEDRHQTGAIFLGPAGAGKSAAAKATAASFGVPLVRLDLGSAKGSLVGQSEQQIRAAMKAIVAIAGEGGAFFVATCNRIENLPPELRRRFRAGLWFFDLPDDAGRANIGRIHLEKAGLDVKSKAFFEGKQGWSGANIRDCCEMARDLQTTLDEAASFVVSAAKQDNGLDRLRSMAAGRFLSASYPGTYQAPSAHKLEVQTSTKRQIDQEEGN